MAVTPSNVSDSRGFKHVCPSQGAAYADKAFCTKRVAKEAARRNVHVCSIKKNNMKGKNKDLDRFYSGMRAPYERIFSKTPKRLRYVGVKKNQFAAFMEAIALNLKRWCVIATACSGGLGRGVSKILKKNSKEGQKIKRNPEMGARRDESSP